MDVPAKVVPEDLNREERSGLTRLLRTGCILFATAGILWLFVFGSANLLVVTGSGRAAQVLLLTFTVLLWPFATLGLLLLICWLVLRIGGWASARARLQPR
ncbi:MAG: hypothetical protein JO270_01350 [Acidobacteriaceae bacterium]|nr:hypothetical protein [Acidobacteriaceae bacterium]